MCVRPTGWDVPSLQDPLSLRHVRERTVEDVLHDLVEQALQDQGEYVAESISHDEWERCKASSVDAAAAAIRGILDGQA